MNNIIVIPKPIRKVSQAVALLNLEQASWLLTQVQGEGNEIGLCITFICFQQRGTRTIRRFFFLDAFNMQNWKHGLLNAATFYRIQLSTSGGMISRDDFYRPTDHELFERVKYLTKERVKANALFNN